jgi:hypothetical protein
MEEVHVLNNESTALEKISDLDKMALELAKSNKKLALAQAEKALAQNDTAEIAYKYTVLQIYMKYKLTEVDAITEGGEIIRGGNQSTQGK